ncbi:unnamed protein product [Phyllotreta striolata]|uniref:Uncharacterized protein n=1 Tax=Phyllotreta striolata TaxID=444603 RepID=A0A9N9TUX1_PHYSR|nr:unnamed protein product [Phyllotreta striolata]
MTYLSNKVRAFLESADDQPAVTSTRSEGRMKSYTSTNDLRAWSQASEDRRQHILEYEAKCKPDRKNPSVFQTEALLKLLEDNKKNELDKINKKLQYLEGIIQAFETCLTDEQKEKIKQQKNALALNYGIISENILHNKVLKDVGIGKQSITDIEHQQNDKIPFSFAEKLLELNSIIKERFATQSIQKNNELTENLSRTDQSTTEKNVISHQNTARKSLDELFDKSSKLQESESEILESKLPQLTITTEQSRSAQDVHQIYQKSNVEVTFKKTPTTNSAEKKTQPHRFLLEQETSPRDDSVRNDLIHSTKNNITISLIRNVKYSSDVSLRRNEDFIETSHDNSIIPCFCHVTTCFRCSRAVQSTSEKSISIMCQYMDNRGYGAYFN